MIDLRLAETNSNYSQSNSRSFFYYSIEGFICRETYICHCVIMLDRICWIEYNENVNISCVGLFTRLLAAGHIRLLLLLLFEQSVPVSNIISRHKQGPSLLFRQFLSPPNPHQKHLPQYFPTGKSNTFTHTVNLLQLFMLYIFVFPMYCLWLLLSPVKIELV